MKNLRSFLLLAFAAFLITSCQKELSFETGIARGSLKKEVSGECLGALLNGSYKKDTLLNATNYVDVQVNITTLGTYVIKTDTLNGYSFSASGIAAITGLNTIRLLGSGRPLAASLDVFNVKFDTSVCQINVPVTGTGGGTTAAVFTLVGSPTTCTGAVQTNNFYATTATNANNYVDIKANVTTAGTFTISTLVVNGVSFSASGALSVGSNQNIRLLADGGTPAAAGSFNYALSTATPASNCGFSLTVQAASTPAQYTFECPSNPTFTGTYQAGVATAGNSVTINVISVAGGSYSITTSTTVNNNGVTFAGTGVLTASPNPQPVILFASGMAQAAGPFTYTLTGMGVTSTCTFTKTYAGTTPPVSTDSIVAMIDGVYKTFKIRDTAQLDNTSIPGYAGIIIFGESNAAGDEGMDLIIAKSGTSITPGIYTVNQFPAAFIRANYSNATDNYTAQSDMNIPPTPQTPGFSITITSITSTKVIGTFSGRIFDMGGTGTSFKTVSGGIFSVTIYP